MPSPYYDSEFGDLVRSGEHRNAIGGLWEPLGKLQVDFLKSQGLQPHHYLLDIGCGSLRLGSMIVDYLEASRYYGVDLSEELLDAGYNKELTDRQRERLPRSHLHTTAEFDFSYLQDRRMDMAIAQSVFTHLPLNHLRDCLMKLEPWMQASSAFYVSFFLCPDHHPIHLPIEHPVSEESQMHVTTYAIKDPYHYRLEDMEYAARDSGLQFQFIGDWGHPRNQQMAVFLKAG